MVRALKNFFRGISEKPHPAIQNNDQNPPLPVNHYASRANNVSVALTNNPPATATNATQIQVAIPVTAPNQQYTPALPKHYTVAQVKAACARNEALRRELAENQRMIQQIQAALIITNVPHQAKDFANIVNRPGLWEEYLKVNTPMTDKTRGYVEKAKDMVLTWSQTDQNDPQNLKMIARINNVLLNVTATHLGI